MALFARTRARFLAAVVCALALPAPLCAGTPEFEKPWADASLPAERRAAMLLSEMSLQEKVAMTHGVCRFEVPGCGFTIGKIPAIPRLGIPALHLTDGPAGVRNGQPATSFPAPVAIAASWNPELAYAVGAAIATESLARGQDVLLSPMINLVRVPLAGRNFETFGEDPHLVSRMGVAHIRGVQDRGVMANAKHYILNNQEHDRRRMTVTVGERALRELYLPAFAAAVREAGVATVMCAYNRVDGVHACHNRRLLKDILRGELGFDGFVMTDWNALRDADATARSAVGAGLNLVMPWPKGDVYGPPWADGRPAVGPEPGKAPLAPLVAAVRSGAIDEGEVDALVFDTLRTMFRFGVFDRPDGPVGTMDPQAHRDLSRRAAEQGAVLLKNAPGVLPLEAGRRVAVIGEAAFRATVGGGGSSAVRPMIEPPAPVDALRGRFGEDAFRAARGIDTLPGAVAVPARAFGANGDPGVRAEYFAGAEPAGEAAVTRNEARIAFDWHRYAPDAGLPSDGWSARFTGTLTVTEPGEYTLELTRAGRARAWLDGEPLFEASAWDESGRGSFAADVTLQAGRAYAVRVEYADPGRRDALLKLGWRRAGQDLREALLAEAVAAARESDIAVVFVETPAREGADRESLSLGDAADGLVEAVAQANPKTVVVVKAGAPVAMPWADRVAAILLTWYPGQEDASATANLLLGDANPGGRLPVTFGRRLEDWPANTPRRYPGIAPPGAPDESWREAVYEEGVFVGYRHFDRSGIEPLFPFGHGLSYTRFEWSGAALVPAVNASGWSVSVEVRNTGPLAGAEVVQLYVSPPGEALPRPPKELKGFARVVLSPGETRRVEIPLPRDALSYWDEAAGQWRVEAGPHRYLLGASARDIRAEGVFEPGGASASEPP